MAEITMLTHPARKLVTALDPRRAADLFRDLLAKAGVTIDGSAPWDIQIRDPRVYARVLRDGTLGFAEAYMDGWWDSQQLDQTLDRLFRARLDDAVRDSWAFLALAL